MPGRRSSCVGPRHEPRTLTAALRPGPDRVASRAWTCLPPGARVRELRGPLFVAAAVVIVTVGIALAGGLFALLAFSALASIVARRAQFWLLDHGLPPWAALIVTVGGFILILVVMAIAVVASIAAVGFRLAEDSAQVQDWIDQAQALWGTVTGVPGGSLPPIEPQAALGVARSVVSALAPAVTSLAFSVLIVIYVLLGAKGLHGRTLRATSAEVIARYDVLATELVTYVKVRAVLGAAAALADTVAAARARRPVRGPVGPDLVPVQLHPQHRLHPRPDPAGGFRAPRARPGVGDRGRRRLRRRSTSPSTTCSSRGSFATTLEVSPVVTIVTILVWTLLIGPAGALLAVPLTIALRALLLPFPNTAWFVAFLGRETRAAGRRPARPRRPAGAGRGRTYNRRVIRPVTRPFLLAPAPRG